MSSSAVLIGEPPEIYEDEYVFWPWARLVEATQRWIQSNASHNAIVLDYMCGTGFLLGRVHAERPDLRCFGCDADASFIAYGRDRYPGIALSAETVLEHSPCDAPEVIVCTGGLHHLPRAHREEFLAKCAEELPPGGTVLIGEEVIADQHSLASRRAAVLDLYRGILDYIIAHEAPAEILSSAVSAMRKELVEDGTSKDSLQSLTRLLERRLSIEQVRHIWPTESCRYGDYLFVCRTPSSQRDARGSDREATLTLPASRGPRRFDPPDVYTRRRHEHPLAPATLWDGSAVWFATRFADTRAILADKRFSADVRARGFPWVTPTSEAVSRTFRTLIRMDPPEHDRIRRALASEFTSARAEAMRPTVRETVDAAIAAMMEPGPPGDLVSAVATVVPARVICTVLGIAYEDQLKLQRLSTRSQSLRPSVEEIREDFLDLRRSLVELVEAKLADPSDDVLTRLLYGDEDRAGLSVDEVVAIARLLLLPTSDIVAQMIALGFLALHEHPDQLAYLRRTPSLMPSAVDELLRYLSVLHTGIPRVAAADVELSGCQIKAGQGVICSLPSANRDPEQFHEPDQLDVRRDARRHLAFGYGLHRCIGQFLARVELDVTLRALLDHPSGMRPAGSIDELRFRDDMLVYGVHELPVTWDEATTCAP